MESPLEWLEKSIPFLCILWSNDKQHLSNQCDLKKEKQQRKSLSSMKVKSE